MKGKAIYNPSGKAGEYSYWAVNFYNGCSADCKYCYCKKGPLSSVWSNKPVLKKSLVNEEMALEIFKKEALNNLSDLQKHGLFFNFTSDPFLPQTYDLNMAAMEFCANNQIPVKALTKQTWWLGVYHLPFTLGSIGFSLTGMDELEPGAAPNEERIEALADLHYHGFNTFASVEPVFKVSKAVEMVKRSFGFVDHYKIGPVSGGKFELSDVDWMIHRVHETIHRNCSVYWKQGFVEKMGIIRDSLPEGSVNADYIWWGRG